MLPWVLWVILANYWTQRRDHGNHDLLPVDQKYRWQPETWNWHLKMDSGATAVLWDWILIWAVWGNSVSTELTTGHSAGETEKKKEVKTHGWMVHGGMIICLQHFYISHKLRGNEHTILEHSFSLWRNKHLTTSIKIKMYRASNSLILPLWIYPIDMSEWYEVIHCSKTQETPCKSTKELSTE